MLLYEIYLLAPENYEACFASESLQVGQTNWPFEMLAGIKAPAWMQYTWEALFFN